MAGGCRLTREIAAALPGAGFRVERLEQRYLRKVPKLVGWTSTGEARPA
jgi:hypothetical protein